MGIVSNYISSSRTDCWVQNTVQRLLALEMKINLPNLRFQAHTEPVPSQVFRFLILLLL